MNHLSIQTSQATICVVNNLTDIYQQSVQYQASLLIPFIAFLQDMIRTSFGTRQYHRLQETKLDPHFEVSLETIGSRVYPSVAAKSKLPRAPVPVGSKQRVFIKSALYAPRGGLCRMSSKMRKAGLQIASASAKLAHAHKSFRRSKTCDGKDLAIWMVVNPMFNQPGPDTPGEHTLDNCALCDKEDMLDIPLDSRFESWVNTAVFRNDSSCSRLSEHSCSLCGDITRARTHYRTQSLGDMSFWGSESIGDSPKWTSFPMLPVKETEESCI